MLRVMLALPAAPVAFTRAAPRASAAERAAARARPLRHPGRGP